MSATVQSTVGSPTATPAPSRRSGLLAIGIVVGSTYVDGAVVDGFTGAEVAGVPIELVGIGCGDDTADRAIQEIRTLVEQDGANVVIGPLSGDEGIARKLAAAYSREGERAFDADLVIAFGADHFNGFFLKLMPAFCIGLKASAVGDIGGFEGLSQWYVDRDDLGVPKISIAIQVLIPRDCVVAGRGAENV